MILHRKTAMEARHGSEHLNVFMSFYLKGLFLILCPDVLYMSMMDFFYLIGERYLGLL